MFRGLVCDLCCSQRWRRASRIDGTFTWLIYGCSKPPGLSWMNEKLASDRRGRLAWGLAGCRGREVDRLESGPRGGADEKWSEL